MLRIGLTGGIGSGKSTVARYLADLGAVVIDSDVLAREVVQPGTPGLAAIVERFGPDVLAGDGSLNRPALGAVVFADDGARRDLEAITHPRIAARTRELLADSPPAATVVHDIPLLVEQHRGAAYHLVLVVGAPVVARVDRLVRDRGMDPADGQRRIAAQADDSERRAAADVWLDNDGSRADLGGAVTRLWEQRLVPYESNLLRGIPVTKPYAVDGPDTGATGGRLAERVAQLLGDQGGTAAVAASFDGGFRIDAQLAEGTVLDPDALTRLAVGGFVGVPPQLPDGPVILVGCDPARVVRVRINVGTADPGQPVALPAS